MISCLASEAPELYELATLIAMYANPSCHYDLQGMDRMDVIESLVRLIEEFEKRVG